MKWWEWLATIPDGKLPTNQKIEEMEEEDGDENHMNPVQCDDKEHL